MDDSSIAKSGELFLQVKGFMKTTKVKKFCVLYKRSAENHPFMDLYEDKTYFINDKSATKVNENKKDSKRIELQHVKYIRGSDQMTSKGKERQIEIRLKSQKHFLQFDNDRDYNDWKTKLSATVDVAERGHDDNSSSSMLSNDDNTVADDDYDDDDDDDDDEVVTLNQMYEKTEQAERFVVEVEPSGLAKMCNIAGNMALLVSTRELAFENPASKSINYSFQIGWMRRFGKKEGKFSFEVGRKCPNGEGEIVCKTENATALHKLISQHSSSRSRTVIPSKRPKSDEQKKKSEKSAATSDVMGIGGPTLATNLARKHPGKSKTPTLIPLNLTLGHATQEDGTSPPSPRHHLGPSGPRSSSSNDSQTEKPESNFSHLSSVKHGPVSDNFAKELDKKLNIKNGKNKSAKVKDESKEEKKEKEKDLKKDKDEKKKGSWGLFHKNRGSKDSEKVKEKHSSAKTESFSLYEEADPVPQSPKNRAPAELLYDEAVTDSCKPPLASEPVEYAQPYTKKGGTSIATESLMYAEVKSVHGNAWISQGRSEEETVHLEDYTYIKGARDQLTNNASPPPIPTKTYTDEDDTYNTLDLNKPKHLQTQSQNIYGMAGGKEIGPLPDPDPDYDSHIESDEELNSGDGVYDDPQYDGYQAPADVMRTNQPGLSDTSEYEDTTTSVSRNPPNIATKPSSTKKPVHSQPQESLYEEIS